MVNMMKLVKQASAMQKNMEKMQEDLAQKSVSFSSGGGMVTAVARGDMTIEGIEIDPKVVDPGDVEMLQDLVLAAVDGALKAAKEMANEEMGKITGGMLGPGGMPAL